MSGREILNPWNFWSGKSVFWFLSPLDHTSVYVKWWDDSGWDWSPERPNISLEAWGCKSVKPLEKVGSVENRSRCLSDWKLPLCSKRQERCLLTHVSIHRNPSKGDSTLLSYQTWLLLLFDTYWSYQTFSSNTCFMCLKPNIYILYYSTLSTGTWVLCGSSARQRTVLWLFWDFVHYDLSSVSCQSSTEGTIAWHWFHYSSVAHHFGINIHHLQFPSFTFRLLVPTMEPKACHLSGRTSLYCLWAVSFLSCHYILVLMLIGCLGPMGPLWWKGRWESNGDLVLCYFPSPSINLGIITFGKVWHFSWGTWVA